MIIGIVGTEGIYTAKRLQKFSATVYSRLEPMTDLAPSK